MVLKKGLTQDKKKEWVHVNNRDKEQNNDIGQHTVQMTEGMMQEQEGGMQEQGEWQAAIANATWMDTMPTQVLAMEPLFLDHSPLGLIVEEQRDTQKRPFRIKNTKAQNQITMLTKEDGTTIKGRSEINQEVVGFYQKLLRQNNRHMPVAQLDVFKAGCKFNKM
ncbi:hypothetical protein RDI58_000701 [Solanum bulbocastanum]|uniref:Uncharacterized protein n=1 Tax=Solanum bulbocastanum TaxID=147425 RepID=A0AAN8UCM6_SOLBU